MLLKKIRTKGFIGHLAGEAENDFVELDFADKTLWLIQGRNGAGKSTLFDALTMAFYRQHRGGASNFVNLVHDKADKAEIFVEFALHGNDYRIAVDLPKKSTVVRRLQFWNGAEWTTKNDEVDDWVSQNLKISYETFVSSVLLRQGEADKFITAKPTPRRAIFLELLQLEFYKKLTERAKLRHKSVGDQLKIIREKLEGLENPTATEIKAQEKLIKEFKKELVSLETEKSVKQKELEGAVQAQKLNGEIEKIIEQQKLDAALFNSAAAVEKKYGYFVELKENLFRLENFWERKNEISQIETDTQANVKKLNKFRAELESVIGSLAENLSAQTKTANKELELENKLISTKTRFDESERKIKEIEIIEGLESQINAANEKLNTLQINIAAVSKKREAIEKQFDGIVSEKDSGEILLQNAKTDFQVWTDRLENRRKVVDKDECPTCGNELKGEETRRKLKAEFDEAVEKVFELEREIENLSENLSETKKQLSKITESQKTAVREHQSLLQTETEFKTKIETWRSQIIVIYENDAREAIRRGYAELQHQIADIASQHKSAKETTENIRKCIGDLEKSKTRIDGDIENTQVYLKKLKERNQTAAANLTKAEKHIPRAWQTHPALRCETELEILRREKDALSDIETEHRHLDDARKRKIILETQIATLAKQLEEIPELHRREVSQVETEFAGIVEKIEASKRKLTDEENLCRTLTDSKKRYDEKSVELKSVKEDFEIWKKLFKAFGKDGLETKVVREAQLKISENANKTLKALSNGNFELELVDTGKEMKIFVRDYSTGEQRQIEYCSGGEKFLTAVSLAIAIGQTASGQNIANTLIIDEGFGALDDRNRVLMVNELSRLTEVFQNGRVIIVSHQDDVQENFANRYRLSKNTEGHTSVETGYNIAI